MGLESATYLNQLVATNPTGSDPANEGDNHIRLIKAALLASFPNVSGAVGLSHAELNQIPADIAATVKLTGNQTVAGVKTFSSPPILPDATSPQHPVSKLQLDAAVFPGALMLSFRSDIPLGWLLADGSAVSRTTYAALFSAIGIVYGAGDGSTTFNLPDVRGEFLRVLDSGRGIDIGRTLGSAQLDAFQGHKHSTDATTGGTSRDGGALSTSATVSASVGDPITDGTNGTPRTAAETRPRNIAVIGLIRY